MRSHLLLEQVQSKDLVQLGRIDVISELLISLPWLLVSFIFAGFQWYLLAKSLTEHDPTVEIWHVF